MPMSNSPPNPDYRDSIPFERRLQILEGMYIAEERRLDHTIDELPETVKKAVLEALAERPQMSEEEHENLRIATKAAAQRVKLRAAVIEKSLTALVWMALSALGYAIWQAFINIVRNKA